MDYVSDPRLIALDKRIEELPPVEPSVPFTCKDCESSPPDYLQLPDKSCIYCIPTNLLGNNEFWQGNPEFMTIWCLDCRGAQYVHWSDKPTTTCGCTNGTSVFPTPEYIWRQTGALRSQFSRSEPLSKDRLLSKQEFKARFWRESVESADKVDTFEGDQLVLSNEESQKRFRLDTEDPVTQDSSADPGKAVDAENADRAGEASTMTTPVVPKMLEASKSSLDKFNVVADGSARAEFIKKLSALELKVLLTEIISEKDNRELLQSTVADLLDSLSSSMTLPD